MNLYSTYTFLLKLVYYRDKKGFFSNFPLFNPLLC